MFHHCSRSAPNPITNPKRKRDGGCRPSLRFGFVFASATLCLSIFYVAVSEGSDTLSFQIYTADGKHRTGPITKITSDWTMHLGADDPLAIRGKEIVSVRRCECKLPDHPLSSQLVFASGDRLPVNLLGGITSSNSRFQVRPAHPLRPAEELLLEVPISFVSILWLQAPKGVRHAEPFLRRLLREKRSNDVMLLRDGDRIDGTFLNLDSEAGCQFKIQNKTLRVPFDKLSAVAFSTLFLAKPRLNHPIGHLVLDNGCRLALVGAEINANKQQITGKTLFRSPVLAPLDAVAALDIYGGRAVYLSDLKPAKYEHTPFFGVAWPFVPDGSVGGWGLKIAGATYDKGLGMHSGSRITYNLNRAYRWFEAVVGLDHRMGKQGNVRIKVLVDGKSQTLRGDNQLAGADRPLKIRLDVRQAQQLTLAVDFGSTGEVQGRVNWANARLIK